MLSEYLGYSEFFLIFREGGVTRYLGKISGSSGGIFWRFYVIFVASWKFQVVVMQNNGNKCTKTSAAPAKLFFFLLIGLMFSLPSIAA